MARNLPCGDLLGLEGERRIMPWTSSSRTASVDSTATRPSRSSLGYGCCLESLHSGLMYNVAVGYKSRPPSQTSPSPKTIVRRRVTSTELSSSKPLDPQFRVKMSSQRSQPHHTQQAYQVCGYGSCTEPIDPTRIGIDRVSRKEISQSRTMPRSKRVWRESNP
jgi:hypothetical protein